jgi:SAM-dependent methyltransferase
MLAPYKRNVDRHYGVPGVFSTVQCTTCGLVMMDPMPSTNDLASLYPDDYYSYQPPARIGNGKRWLRNLLGPHKTTYTPHFDRPGLMLDIGCGAGHHLLEMEQRGWQVKGAELSRGAAEAGRKAGLDIRGGELTDAGFDPESFDFIRSNHSFEHIANPNEILPEIYRLLKPGGKLFIGVPNYRGYWARMAGKYWWYFGLPVHVYNYDPKSLSTLLKRHGFTVEQVRHNSDYGATNGSLQLWLNRHQFPLTDAGWALKIRPLRIIGHWLAKLPDLFRSGDCIEVIASKPK